MALTLDRGGCARPGRERLRRSGTVDLPPMPADGHCRWCTGSTWTSFDGKAICSRGCADRPIFDCTCRACRRGFQTGESPTSDQCWQCRDRVRTRLTKAYAEPALKDTGYMADKRRQGASREAAKSKDSL